MKPDQIIFLESNPNWEVLFRQVTDCPYPILRTSNFDELKSAVASSNGSVICVEIGPLVSGETLTWLGSLGAERGHRVIGLVRKEHKHFSLGLREFGFADMISSVLDFDRILRFAERHFDRLPRQNESWRDTIESSMPWKDARL